MSKWDYLLEADEPLRFKDLFKVRLNSPNADFWITRLGAAKTIGKPVKEFYKGHWGITVVRKDVLLPQYLYYVAMAAHQGNIYAQYCRGVTVSSISKDAVYCALKEIMSKRRPSSPPPPPNWKKMS